MMRQHFRSLLTFDQMVQRAFNISRRWRCVDSTVKEILQKTDRLHHADHHTDVEKMYKTVMRKVPQPVVVVTTGIYTRSGWNKRGMTCTSFTSVSFCPPIVSICIQNPSRMHDMLLQSKNFAVHVLARHQVSYGMTFAQFPKNGCQFESVPHYQGENNVPVILGCCAVMECKAHSVHTVGDHHVWYGEVQDAHVDDKISHPMLYHYRSFRSVGDEIFIQSFEEATLPFENWTHEAHLRMAWTYIKEHGREGAEPYVKTGIKNFNEKNKEKIKTGYSETITMFYMFAVSDAITQTPNVMEISFEDFLKQNGHLLDRSLMYEYYSRDIISNPTSKTEPHLDIELIVEPEENNQYDSNAVKVMMPSLNGILSSMYEDEIQQGRGRRALSVRELQLGRLEEFQQIFVVPLKPSCHNSFPKGLPVLASIMEMLVSLSDQVCSRRK